MICRDDIQLHHPAVRPATLRASRGRRVFVHDCGDELDSLVSAVGSLGYDPVTGDPGTASVGCVAALLGVPRRVDLGLARVVAGRCPVLIHSRERGFEFRLEAARAGAEALLSPPLDMTELSGWLEDCLREVERPITVLIVDDDPLAGEVYSEALRDAGMQVHATCDPSGAANAVETLAPDVILLDVNMPGANGLEVARIVRQSRRSLSLPIIFLSAERSPERQNLARSIGGDDFITKPVDLGFLVMQVKMRAERSLALRQVMERDSLTGVLNHARFKERLAAEIERSGRTGSAISVCLLDIDHFKLVNDMHGHLTGDQVLRTVAHVLVGGLRKTDVVARYGGEEFGVILLDTPAADALAVMDKLRRRFGEIVFQSEAGAFSATFSAGLCEAMAGSGVDQLIACADKALYQAKNAGRDRVASA